MFSMARSYASLARGAAALAALVVTGAIVTAASAAGASSSPTALPRAASISTGSPGEMVSTARMGSRALVASTAGPTRSPSLPRPSGTVGSDPTTATGPPIPPGTTSAPTTTSRPGATSTAPGPTSTVPSSTSTAPGPTSTVPSSTSTSAPIVTPTKAPSMDSTPQPSSTSSAAAPATTLDDPIEIRYTALGGVSGVLGEAVGGRISVGAGIYQQYRNGHIWWSAPTGAWETLRTVDARYGQIGGATGVLGFPASPPMSIAGGSWQWFSGGVIWSSPSTGSWETYGPINGRYTAISGPFTLGFPTSAPGPIAGGSWQWFSGGVIWSSPSTGAWETSGGINSRYTAISGPFTLGFPTSAPGPIAGGSWQWFSGGVIWSSPSTGAWETSGGINSRYTAISGPFTLGFPTSAPGPIAGGSWQWFSGGVIWSSPSTGAWETSGAINSEYLSGSGPWSWYGWPTSAPYAYYGGQRQDFRGGSLLSGAAAVLDPTFAQVSAADVWATWRPGCPVGPESLTLIHLNYWGFDNVVHRGEIIVRSDLAGRVANIFGAALGEHYPIRKMWRVDYYGGSDPTAMAADDTSGFNCRQVTGGTGLSPHSYGIAIDVNTVENPYYAGGRWWPTTEYVNRGYVRWGMLYSWSNLTVAFTNNGYSWGGSYLDYQHYQFVG